MSRLKCRKCGAESYAAGDTGLVCIRCYDQQAERITELEAKNKSQVEHIDLLKQCDDSSTDVISKMDTEIEQLQQRIKELEADYIDLKDVQTADYNHAVRNAERIKELEEIYLGQIRVVARSRLTYKERVERMAALAEQALKG